MNEHNTRIVIWAVKLMAWAIRNSNAFPVGTTEINKVSKELDERLQ